MRQREQHQHQITNCTQKDKTVFATDAQQMCQQLHEGVAPICSNLTAVQCVINGHIAYSIHHNMTYDGPSKAWQTPDWQMIHIDIYFVDAHEMNALLHVC